MNIGFEGLIQNEQTLTPSNNSLDPISNALAHGVGGSGLDVTVAIGASAFEY